jgi:hypothetical protein
MAEVGAFRLALLRQLVWCPANTFIKKERFADPEFGTGFPLKREAVRDSSASFALLTSVRMTHGGFCI